MLGRDVRRALFSEDESALGCIISVDSSPYRVVGTFDEVGDGSEQQIYIPLPTAQALHTGFSPQELWALFELGAQVTLETLVLCGVSGYAGLVVVSGIGSDALPRTPRSP